MLLKFAVYDSRQYFPEIERLGAIGRQSYEHFLLVFRPLQYNETILLQVRTLTRGIHYQDLQKHPSEGLNSGRKRSSTVRFLIVTSILQ